MHSIAIAMLVAGALNPVVTEQTVSSTICNRSWLSRQRPPVEWSEPIKRRLFHSQRAPGRLRDYELDHLIPLELGGCPDCLDNLWLQPIREARIKDQRENALHREVCREPSRLREAQREMREWPQP